VFSLKGCDYVRSEIECVVVLRQVVAAAALGAARPVAAAQTSGIFWSVSTCGGTPEFAPHQEGARDDDPGLGAMGREVFSFGASRYFSDISLSE
jgi:hypothetical protein